MILYFRLQSEMCACAIQTRKCDGGQGWQDGRDGRKTRSYEAVCHLGGREVYAELYTKVCRVFLCCNHGGPRWQGAESRGYFRVNLSTQLTATSAASIVIDADMYNCTSDDNDHLTLNYSLTI